MISVSIYPEPPVSKKEILRYAGGGDERTEKLADDCLSEILPCLSYKVCRAKVPVKICKNTVDFGFVSVRSENLAKNLDGCRNAVIFAATVGVAPDRFIAKYSALSPARALMFQAIGAERIEALCDTVSSEYENSVPRFSPGYGDLPLDFQKKIFSLLDCPKNIGLTLNESLLMSPTKSVTAIIGLK